MAYFAPKSWPKPLADEAYYGLAGEIVNTIEPHTEADPAVLMIHFLVAFGNVIGRHCHFRVGGARHYTNLFAVIVGETARSRKETAWAEASSLFRGIDPAWPQDRIRDGLSSGEGLIWAVRNPTPADHDSGAKDKRLLIVEGEFISPLKVMGRQGNILSPVIRNAWDSGNLNILTKNSPAQATDAHVSIIGHITRDELLSQFNRIEMANGFGNRFLWVCAKRSQVLPEGGSMNSADIEPLTLKLKQRVQFSSSEREITFEGFNPARCGSIYRDEVERSQSCNG